MNQFELEQEVGKMTKAMTIRNSAIGGDLISHLKERLTIEGVAAVMIVSIERLIWFDSESVVWSINHLIPGDVMREIHKITSVVVCKRLIGKGFKPGQDFSIDREGKLLLSNSAKTAVTVC